MFEVKFETGNAQFEGVADEYWEQVASVLRGIASKVERGSHSGPVMDVNGNTIGHYYLDRE